MSRKRRTPTGRRPRPGSGSTGEKRLTATIDLRAEEVQPSEPAERAKTPEDPDMPLIGEPESVADGETQTEADRSSTSSGQTDEAPARGAPLQTPVRSFFTYLTAGLFGGLLVLGGTLALHMGEQNDPQLEARISGTEQIAPLFVRLEEGEKKRRKFEAAQNQMEQKIAQFEDRLGAITPTIETLKGRLDTLEQSFKTLTELKGTRAQGALARAATLLSQMQNLEVRLEKKLKEGFAEQKKRTEQDLETLKKNVQSVSASVLKVDDTDKRVEPLAKQMSALEEKVAGLLARENKIQTETRKTTLVATLVSLKRAIDRGGAFRAELDAVSDLSPVPLKLEVLERSADHGVPTLLHLQSLFPKAIQQIMNAEQQKEKEGSLITQILSNAKSVVSIRRTGELKGTDTEAIVARMENRVKDGNFSAALKEAEGLKGAPRKAARDWLEKARSKVSIEADLKHIERILITVPGSTRLNQEKR